MTLSGGAERVEWLELADGKPARAAVLLSPVSLDLMLWKGTTYHDVAVVLDAGHVLALLDKEALPVLAKREALLHFADLWETVRPYSVCSQVRQKMHLLRSALLTALQPVRILIGPDNPRVRKPFLRVSLVVDVTAALEDLAQAMRWRRCNGVRVRLKRRSERYDTERSS